MKQQCSVALIYVEWAFVLLALVVLLLRREYAPAGVLLLGLPLFGWAYVRVFPAISRYLGYGSVKDEPAAAPVAETAPAKVVLYTALGCPFCPIVKQRLLELQKAARFDLQEVDVTLRPDLVVSKRISSVPVVEVETRRRVGNATTRQLADLILSTRAIG